MPFCEMLLIIFDVDLFNLKANKEKEEAESKMLEGNLQFLEQVLREEDPDFVAGLEKLNISLPKNESNGKVKLDFILDKAVKINHKELTRQERINSLHFLLVMFEFRKNTKKVLLFWVVFIGIVVGINFTVKKTLKPEETKFFIHSVGDLHVPVYSFNSINQAEMFFDNPLFTKNVMVIPRMVVNLVPSETSSNLPMLSFEVVLEALSNEPIIEIKDREAEFRDYILRVAEDFTYDELITIEGKEKLSELILDKINSMLTQNQIRKVYFNQFILKN